MGLGDGISQKKPCHHLGPFFFLISSGKSFWLPKRIFEKKIEKCKKGDEITPFDGIRLIRNQHFGAEYQSGFRVKMTKNFTAGNFVI